MPPTGVPGGPPTQMQTGGAPAGAPRPTGGAPANMPPPVGAHPQAGTPAARPGGAPPVGAPHMPPAATPAGKAGGQAFAGKGAPPPAVPSAAPGQGPGPGPGPGPYTGKGAPPMGKGGKGDLSGKGSKKGDGGKSGAAPMDNVGQHPPMVPQSAAPPGPGVQGVPPGVPHQGVGPTTPTTPSLPSTPGVTSPTTGQSNDPNLPNPIGNRTYRPQRPVSKKIDQNQIPSPVGQQADHIVYQSDSREAPPKADWQYVAEDCGVAVPRFVRSSMYAVAPDADLLKKTGMPWGLAVCPLADLVPGEVKPRVVPTAPTGPVRCLRCRAFINSKVKFLNNGRSWECNLCEMANAVAPDYFANIDPDGNRTDVCLFFQHHIFFCFQATNHRIHFSFSHTLCIISTEMRFSTFQLLFNR